MTGFLSIHTSSLSRDTLPKRRRPTGHDLFVQKMSTDSLSEDEYSEPWTGSGGFLINSFETQKWNPSTFALNIRTDRTGLWFSVGSVDYGWTLTVEYLWLRDDMQSVTWILV